MRDNAEGRGEGVGGVETNRGTASPSQRHAKNKLQTGFWGERGRSEVEG